MEPKQITPTPPPDEAFEDAYPHPGEEGGAMSYGLTKREHVAALLLPAFVGALVGFGGDYTPQEADEAVDVTVRMADLLLTRLQS